MIAGPSSNGDGAPQKKLNVGIAGLGAGAVQVIRAMEAAPYLDIVAAADVRPQALSAFRERYEGRTYDTVDALAKDPDVDVVWVSTPNIYHCENTVVLAENGKHVVVEKPMAVTLEEAERMVEAAERNGVNLLCGHTASLMAGFRAMRRVITSGRLGKVTAINCWSYVDFMFRPRMPHELDMENGGAMPYNQGPHQFDVVRLMGGGMVRSVRGMVSKWMDARTSPGYYVAYLEFEDGAPATIVKNGYGYFLTTELVPWASDIQGIERNRDIRRALRNGQPYDEATGKEAQRFGGSDTNTLLGPRENITRSGFQLDCGLVVVSCEGGDIRQADGGLTIYDDDGTHFMPVEGVQDERMAELDEMYQAITEGRPVHHDGRWGMATLECVLGMMQSGRERREIPMTHQCPAWE